MARTGNTNMGTRGMETQDIGTKDWQLLQLRRGRHSGGLKGQSSGTEGLQAGVSAHDFPGTASWDSGKTPSLQLSPVVSGRSTGQDSWPRARTANWGWCDSWMSPASLLHTHTTHIHTTTLTHTHIEPHIFVWRVCQSLNTESCHSADMARTWSV